MKNQQHIFLQDISKHKGIINKVTRIYVDNEQDREDLQQEIIYHLWKSYSSFKGVSQFSTWMYRVALNTAITFTKKENKRVDKYQLTVKINPKEVTYNNTEDRQLAHFYQAVQLLNKIEKALILLFIEGLSHKEIGKNLGLSEVNTRVKLNRTKNKLQKIIKKSGYEF